MTLALKGKHVRRVAAGVAVLAAAAAIEACGSSSSGGSGAATGSNASSSANKSPITIGSIAAAHTAAINFAGIFDALQEGISMVNKDGGINGHPLKLWTCNSQFQAAQELACIRQAVSAKVDVMVGSNIDFDGAPYAEFMQKAKIPDVMDSGPLPIGFEGPLTYELTFPQSEFASCVSPQLTNAAGGKKIVAVTNVPGALAAATEEIWKLDARARGYTWLSPILAPTSTADWAPYVASAEKSGANIVIFGLTGGAPQAFVRASSQAGAKYTLCTAIGLSGTGGYYNLGAAADRLYVGSDTAALTSTAPGVQKFVAAMKAAQAAGLKNASIDPHTYLDQTAEAWLGLQAVIQAASTIKGDVTKETLAHALQSTKYDFGGMIPSFSFADSPMSGTSTSDAVLKTFQHVWNSTGYLWKWNPGTGQYTPFAVVPNTFGLAVKGAGS